MKFQKGIPSNHKISSYTANFQCGTLTNPVFSYTGYNGTTGNLLNPLTDFASVDPVTGAITTTAASLVGNFTIKVVGTLPDNQSVEEIFTLEGEENLPAHFDVKFLPDQLARLKASTLFTLPPYSDPEGQGSIRLYLEPSPSNTFITLSQNQLTVTPT